MQKVIKEVKTIGGQKVLQVTTLNERWYARPTTDPETGLPTYEYLPSVTWISGYYPKGIAFWKWLANKGWDEAERLRVEAGDKGSKVHYATSDIDAGISIDIKQPYPNKETGELEELRPEEIEAIQSFIDWLDVTNPELLANEQVVFGDGYAGTIDRIYRIGDQIWIVDLKTSQNIWEEFKLQISAYSHANVEYGKLGISDKEWQNRKLAILQVGYRRNRVKYKFTEVEDKFDLFLMAKKIWENENPNAKPKEAIYPLILKSKVRTKKVKIKKSK